MRERLNSVLKTSINELDLFLKIKNKPSDTGLLSVRLISCKMVLILPGLGGGGAGGAAAVAVVDDDNVGVAVGAIDGAAEAGLASPSCGAEVVVLVGDGAGKSCTVK